MSCSRRSWDWWVSCFWVAGWDKKKEVKSCSRVFRGWRLKRGTFTGNAGFLGSRRGQVFRGVFEKTENYYERGPLGDGNGTHMGAGQRVRVVEPCAGKVLQKKRERERECVRRRNWNPNFQDLLIVTRLSKVRKGPWNYQGLFVCLFFLKWEHPKFWSLVWNLTWVLYPCSSP